MSQVNLDSTQLDQLHELLEAQIAQYQLAVNTLQQKKEALVSGKPQSLLQIDRQLLTISRKTAQMEKQREEKMLALGYPNGRLEYLITQMDRNSAKRFQNTRTRLLCTAEDVNRLNRESRGLLDLSLAWIQETVEIITAAISPEGASYTAQGSKPGQSTEQAPIQSTVNHSA